MAPRPCRRPQLVTARAGRGEEHLAFRGVAGLLDLRRQRGDDFGTLPRLRGQRIEQRGRLLRDLAVRVGPQARDVRRARAARCDPSGLHGGQERRRRLRPLQDLIEDRGRTGARERADHRGIGVGARVVAERREQARLERIGRLRRRQHGLDRRERRRALARHRDQARADLGAAIVARPAVVELAKKTAARCSASGFSVPAVSHLATIGSVAAACRGIVEQRPHRIGGRGVHRQAAIHLRDCADDHRLERIVLGRGAPRRSARGRRRPAARRAIADTRSVSASGRPYPRESVTYAAAAPVAAAAIAERVQLSVALREQVEQGAALFAGGKPFAHARRGRARCCPSAASPSASADRWRSSPAPAARPSA